MKLISFLIGTILQATLASNSLIRRLVLGKKVSPVDWMVNFVHPLGYRCGGVLYTESMSITVASCNTHAINDWQAIITLFNKSSPVNKEEKIKLSVLSRTDHPAFNSETLEYDLSVWVINNTSSRRTIVDLGQDVIPEIKLTVFKLGWGTTERKEENDFEYKLEYPDDLQKIEVPLRSTKECLDNYTKKKETFIPETMLCTGEDHAFKNTCFGDAGGPVYKVKENGRINLIGIISATLKCGAGGLYDLEVKVSAPKVISFILDQFEKLENQNTNNTSIPF